MFFKKAYEFSTLRPTKLALQHSHEKREEMEDNLKEEGKEKRWRGKEEEEGEGGERYGLRTQNT